MKEARAAERDVLLLGLRTLVVLLGAVNVGAAMVAESMNEDGIHYLDQGDAWVRGDWSVAVNGTWSPLYPAILGLVMRVVRPPMAWEFPLVQVVNFLVYLLAFVCFEYFWRQVTARYFAPLTGEASKPDRLPRWAWQVIGYGLFIWSTTTLIRLFAVTPDMLVAAAVFLTSGLLLRLPGGEWSRGTGAALGAALGAGYLAKAAMFPLALVALAIAAVIAVRSGRSLRVLVPAVAAFVLVAGPFLTALSLKVGRFTFSEVGRVSYLKHVLRAPFPHYEPGSSDIAGEPLHPIARSATTPVVYSYNGREGVTYPLAYDQGYWYAGLRPRLRPALQLQAIALNLQKYFDLFIRLQGILTGAVLMVLLTRRVQRPFDAGTWVLGLWGIAALGMYGLVYAEGRYLAPFIVLIWTALLMSVRLRPAPEHVAWLRAAGIVVIGSFAINIGTYHLDGLNALVGIAPVAKRGPVSGSAGVAAPPTAVATALQRAGLRPNEPIGVIGAAVEATWARLARLRIAADVAPRDVAVFWSGTAADQRAVLEAFASAGARAVIAEQPADGQVPPEWERVGRTPYLMRFMTRDEGSRGPRAPSR